MIAVKDEKWRALDEAKDLKPGEEAVNIRAITSIGIEDVEFPAVYWFRLFCGRQINLRAQQATLEVRNLAKLVMEAG